MSAMMRTAASDVPGCLTHRDPGIPRPIQDVANSGDNIINFGFWEGKVQDSELISRLRDHPSGFGLNGTYHSTAMFVAGYDLARSGGMLRGFHEWLSVRDGELSSQHWILRILYEAVPEFRFQGFEQLRLTPEQDRKALDHFLSSLLKFLAERDDRRALPRMYAAYDSLMSSVYDAEEG
ncbi:hypothetical protein ACIQ9R_20525 [Streptomyces sp. NPDC094447]|uniref:hypothetical protein n=1 Tax=Streptomyces sp. NPDC094447 TaxID=3366062 RepID=UPI00381E8F99